jgi:hypothetical protein
MQNRVLFGELKDLEFVEREIVDVVRAVAVVDRKVVPQYFEDVCSKVTLVTIDVVSKQYTRNIILCQLHVILDQLQLAFRRAIKRHHRILSKCCANVKACEEQDKNRTNTA